MDMTRVTPDLAGLKALAHPTRMRMLGLLRLDGPSTATALAARLGLNSGATSYHLRHLARHGFIVEDDERGNGRERWWRAAHQSTWTTETPDDPEGRDTMDAYLHAAVVNHAQTVQAAMEERPLLPYEWRHASTVSDWTFRLTAARARELAERLAAVFEEFSDMDDPEARQFTVQYDAFPRPGQVNPDPNGDAPHDSDASAERDS